MSEHTKEAANARTEPETTLRRFIDSRMMQVYEDFWLGPVVTIPTVEVVPIRHFSASLCDGNGWPPPPMKFALFRLHHLANHEAIYYSEEP